MRTPASRAISILALAGLGLAGAARAQAPATLPVYDVSGAAPTEDQIVRLAAALGTAREKLAVRNGAVAFLDRDRFLAVPRKAVADPALVARFTRVEDTAPPRLQALDFDAIRAIRPPAEDLVVRRVGDAIARAGLTLPPSARPVIGHTTLTAHFSKADGDEDIREQPLDTRVSYAFTLGDRYPLIGPGAQAAATFGADGAPTHFYWAARDLKPGVQVHIRPDAEVRDAVARRLPAGAKIDLALVYWAPSLEGLPGRPAPAPAAVIPWYEVHVQTPRTNPTTGKVTWTRAKVALEPATDDARFVPSAHLAVTGRGDARVDAAVEVKGGRSPYTYLWSGSNPALAAETGAHVSYAALARGAAAPGAMETVGVTVIDANGVAVRASATLAVTPQAPDTRVVELDKKKSTYKVSFGTESPREPDFAVDRVGWEQGMAFGAVPERFSWIGANAWPGDFIEPSPKGSVPYQPWINGDADYDAINTVTIALNNTDGDADGFDSANPGETNAHYATAYFSVPADEPIVTVGMDKSNYVSATKTANPSYKGAWGPEGPNDHLLWLIFDACDTLDTVDGNGLDPWKRWSQAFGGLHMLLGWNSTEQVGDGSFESTFGVLMLGLPPFLPAQSVLQAWLGAATNSGTGHGLAAAIGPIGPGGITNQDDYFPGRGSSGPTIQPADITGWWYIHQ